MKHLIPLFAIAFYLLSCGGSEESSNTSTNEEVVDTTQVDSLISALSFTEYAERVSALSADAENLDSAYAWYETSKSAFTQEELDSACLLYVALMDKIAMGVYGEYDQEAEFEKMYNPYGFNVGMGEGELWLNVDTYAATEKFRDDLSKDLAEFMKLGEITGQQYSADAGLIISFSELGDLLIDLEDRIKANRESKYYGSFIGSYKMYLDWMMWGMDNTPTINYEGTGWDTDEVTKAYEKLIDDKDHRTGEIIQRHWHSLEAGNDYGAPYDQRWHLTVEEVEYYLFEDELEPFE